ncbi:YbhB/YbcL family Raf kinase inhibitor-like protein [Allomeiothermus silvanus]|uniref:YbhB/YbcL family Raf kinase inhibitor-like protein n=1 Tax=Allomeiothermus silvanus TaxID=52022 RepID=UPI0023F15281|nr:YbhB/YbcL family Raf kinase inhibitor-like protein [Allomeiothermus silvanus]
MIRKHVVMTLGVLGLALAQGGFRLELPGLAPQAPLRSVCEGRNVSPAVVPLQVPARTQSLALIFWDSAKGALIARWLVYDIPPAARLSPGLPRAALLAHGIKQGQNGLGRLGYDAPCQPGMYQVDLYALDVPSLGLPPGATLHEVKAAIQRHRLAEAIRKVSLER